MKPSQENPFKEILRFQKDNDLCMKCGFCMGDCPTYREELVESSVARGRNALVKGLIKGELEFTPELEERLDKCTLCKSCTFVCPAHVDIPSVVIAARADKYRKLGLKFPYNIVYHSILPRRVLFPQSSGHAAPFAPLLGGLRQRPPYSSGSLEVFKTVCTGSQLTPTQPPH